MNLRTTTPVSASLYTRVVLLIVATLLAILLPIQMITRPASADQYDDKINLIQKNINSYKAQAVKLGGQIDKLQGKVAQLENQVKTLQAQLDLSQAKYDKLIAQIAATEKKIEDNKDALGVTIADLYVDDQISPLEMLASSSSVSDYLDKQEYRNSVRDELVATINKVKDLKKQLSKQRDDAEAVLARQKIEKSNLVASKAEQQRLLNDTKGKEANYRALVASSVEQLNDVAAQQRAYYQSLLNNNGGANSGVHGSFQWNNLSPNNGAGGCVGGYPYCMPQDTFVDPWQLYNRECVSYVAWALENRFNKYVSGFHGEGNAWEWSQAHTKPNGTWNPTGSAISYSGAVRVYNPQPGDVVVLPRSNSFAPIGHVMIVESASGGWMHVSQYNFFGTGQYSTMDVKNSGVVLLRFKDI